MNKSKMTLAGLILIGIFVVIPFSSALGQIFNVQVSNLTSSSATITWTTSDSTDGCVNYGLATNALDDTSCDSRPDDDVHRVDISGLSATTTYYFEVVSGGTADNNGGAYYAFTTAAAGSGDAHVIFGWVMLSGGVTPAFGTIVTVQVKSNSSSSSLLCALTYGNGAWSLNLGNLKNVSDGTVFSYNTGDSIFVDAQGAADGVGQAKTTVSGSSPQNIGTIVLGAPVNEAPVVSDIADQSILEGQSFAYINLDDYVNDADNSDEEMAWTYWGNADLLVEVVDRVAAVSVPYPEWSGSESIWFKACDPGGLCDSTEAAFTVAAVNDAPVVSDIPDQSILVGQSFASINLDDYVDDVDNSDAEMTWIYWGNVDLLVDIVNRVATISVPYSGWTGSESVWFKVCDPGELCDSTETTFTVTRPGGVISVDMDIKPQSCPNPLNTKSNGVLPVAILGTEDFDVMGVDPNSLLLEGVAPLRWNFEDVSTPIDSEQDTCACTTRRGDGYTDMTLKFETQEIADALEAQAPLVDGETRILTIAGFTHDSTLIQGHDCLLIIRKGRFSLSVDDVPGYSLGNNYPNPCNPETEISFSLPEEADVTLTIYNVAGQKVRTLVDQLMPSGVYTVSWNGKDEKASSVASGIYFYRLKTENFERTKRMVVVK
jgi:hypothetical protein